MHTTGARSSGSEIESKRHFGLNPSTVNDIMIFRHLTVDFLKQVTELKLKVGERELKLQLTDNAMRFLIKESSNLK